MQTYRGGSTLSQFGSQPQNVVSQIQQDLRGGQGQVGYPAQGFSGSTLSQFGTNPQVVQSHIRQDLAPSYGQPMVSAPQGPRWGLAK
ncbi:hypothetical protein GCM10025857_11650 [Alicyclobacillus contaminans]|nr:hypothetical protein GCM10025857_11650 [Alicyclobacillus contaminans]